ncbi:MAG: ARPP-1 family domain-containing protein [Planctomycetota bacterium]
MKGTGLLLGTVLAASCGGEEPLPPVVGELTVSGPYAHENLEVFLVHGPDRLPSDQRIQTLREALENETVVVHETGNVNELAIENLSDDTAVYVQSGDVLKGGKQDRAIAVDLIVEPGSGRLPLAAFCVEEGRWRSRGLESTERFQTCNNLVATRSLKVALKRGMGNQQSVWREVRNYQLRLVSSLGDLPGVIPSTSRTSLELTMEGAKVRETAARYIQALEPIIDDKKDVVGFAFAINGKVNSADVYGSRRLFRMLWKRLLDACVAEAIAEPRGRRSLRPTEPVAVQRLLADDGESRRKVRDVTDRIKMVSSEDSSRYVFETLDTKHPSGWVHRSYLMK